MKKLFAIVPRWIPALAVMSVIFYFSSQPGESLPHFFSWDKVVKKGGHMLGYGLLALSYLYALGNYPRRYLLAWALSILYAATDEFHQSFTAGRNASLVDVLVFDHAGALAALWLARYLGKKDNQ